MFTPPGRTAEDLGKPYYVVYRVRNRGKQHMGTVEHRRREAALAFIERVEAEGGEATLYDRRTSVYQRLRDLYKEAEFFTQSWLDASDPAIKAACERGEQAAAEEIARLKGFLR